MPGYRLGISTDALSVLEAVEAEMVRPLPLTDHAGTRRLGRLMLRIARIQVAGVPDRDEPDTGEVSFAHPVGVPDRVGHVGFVGGKCRPKGKAEDRLGWFRRARA